VPARHTPAPPPATRSCAASHAACSYAAAPRPTWCALPRAGAPPPVGAMKLHGPPAFVLLCGPTGAPTLLTALAGTGEEDVEKMLSFNIFKILLQHFQNTSSIFSKY